MNQDINWETVSILYYPLELINLTKKTVLDQTEEQHPFKLVQEQEISFYGFHKNTLTNDQWYEKFNTKVDVGNVVGVTM